MNDEDERERRMEEEKKWKEDPTKLLDIPDMESEKAWMSNFKAGRLRRFLCWIGWHDPIDAPGLPTHCRYCFITLTGEKLNLREMI